MKTDNINSDIQITLEGFAQILQEIKEVVINNPQSALTADLLIKIQQTIDQSKKGITAEELEVFRNELINSIRQIQEDANDKFSNFLNQKIEELREIAKQPAIIENRYSIDFISSKTVIAIIILCLSIGISSYFNYNQSQENKRLKHNDIKYRYVQMKGGVSFNDITYLNESYAQRPQYRDSIRSKVIEFEKLIRQKVYNESVTEKNEENNKRIDKRLKELTK